MKRREDKKLALEALDGTGLEITQPEDYWLLRDSVIDEDASVIDMLLMAQGDELMQDLQDKLVRMRGVSFFVETSICCHLFTIKIKPLCSVHFLNVKEQDLIVIIAVHVVNITKQSTKMNWLICHSTLSWYDKRHLVHHVGLLRLLYLASQARAFGVHVMAEFSEQGSASQLLPSALYPDPGKKHGEVLCLELSAPSGGNSVSTST